MNPEEPIARVYLVEDSYGDIVLTRAILQAEKLHLELIVFRDGVEVIDQLTQCDADEGPDLVLLDFNLPKVGGVEVLRYMKTGRWSAVPVAVMSGSIAEADQRLVAEMGALCFLRKPLDIAVLSEAIEPLSSLNMVNRGSDKLLVKSQPTRPQA